MAFYKQKRKDETQIEWKHMQHDAGFDANKLYHFYAVIKVGDRSLLSEYDAKYRSEAVAIFEEESRLLGGKVENIGVYK